MHQLLAAEQLAAHEVVTEGAEPDAAVGGIGHGAALQDVADAQHQFARLERFREIIGGAGLQPVDAVLGFAHRGQQQDRDPRRFGSVRKARVRSSPLSPGIITSSTSRSKAKPASLARASRRPPRGSRESRFRQIAAQEFAQPRIVVDDQEMRFGIAHRRQYTLPPRRSRPLEAAAVVLLGDHAEQHLAETLDRRRAGLAVGRRHQLALRLGQLRSSSAAAFGQVQQALAAVRAPGAG